MSKHKIKLQNIAIASGKGGAGKTTISTNLFYIFEKNNAEAVTLYDCDVEEPNDMLFFKDTKKSFSKDVNIIIPEIDENKCTYCRKCADYCEFNAISIIPPIKYASVSNELCHSCGACFHACEFNALLEKKFHIGNINSYETDLGNKIIEGRLKVGLPAQTPLIKELKKEKNEESTFNIIDAPPGTSCSAVNSIINSDILILVAEPTPFGFNDFKLIYQLAKEMKLNPFLIINKAGEGNRDIYDFAEKEKIQILAEIPYKKEWAKDIAQGKILSKTDNAYKKIMQDIYDELYQISACPKTKEI